MAAAAIGVSLGGIATGALAQSLTDGHDQRIDANTGQDARVWPPDRLFDYLHVRLDITIPDMTAPRFEGRERLTLAAIGAPRSEVVLRAGPGLTITRVSLGGAALAFTHEDEVLRVALPSAASVGEKLTLVIDYTADRPGGGGAGLTFSKDDPSTPEFDPMCHAQGQPESNHKWFPIHDFPNERLTSEVVATVPAGFQAVSNGRLLSTVRQPGAGAPKGGGENGKGGDGGTVTYHWLQNKPHAPYLITLVVGKFDVVNVGGPASARPGLWLPVYGPVGSAEVLEKNFGNTADMVAHFETLFDEPYPWDKYANVMCRNFAAGAMENTSCTTFAQGIGLARSRRMVEGTNAHELVHQWFGDLVGYKSWEHLWLGEGWATYGEALWAEKVRGKAGYQRAVAQSAAQAKMGSRGVFPTTMGSVATNLYSDPDSRFNPLVVYAKGGWLLHSLRVRLGDETFWAGVRLYLDRFKFQQAETDDFRRCLEEVSGQSLERYFDEYAYRPGVPRIRVDLTWDEAGKRLGVEVEQIQKIDADNPAFAVSLPIQIELGEGQTRTVTVDTDSRLAMAEFALERKPVKVVVDPQASVLADAKIRQSLEEEVSWWSDQLRDGPTEFARVQAAEALADLGTPAALRALAQAAWSGRDDEDDRRMLTSALLTGVMRRAAAGEPDAVAARE